MRIINVVSSNIVKDPRIVKQAEIIKSMTDDYIIIGKEDDNVTDARKKALTFKYKLIKQNNNNNLFSKIFSRLQYGLKIIQEIKRFNPDIIHSNDFDMLFFSYFAKKKDMLLIYDAHEIYSKNGLIAKNKFISHIIMQIEKRMLKKVDYFLTVSQAAKEYYIDQNYEKTPIVITNVPIKKDFMQPLKNEKFQVIYQGIISEGRGYEEFAKSAIFLKEFLDVELIIRGYGPTLEKIKKFKEKEKVDNLSLEPAIEMNQMIYEASKSHVGIVMTKPISINYQYTISNKFFEYIHAGLPLILSPVKEHIYLNQKYKVGIVIDNVTPEEIANAVKKLYQDEKLYNELKNNVCRIKSFLTWQNESKKLIEIYKNEYNR